MTRKALLVIDVLNDFLDPKGTLYCGDDSRRWRKEADPRDLRKP